MSRIMTKVQKSWCPTYLVCYNAHSPLIVHLRMTSITHQSSQPIKPSERFFRSKNVLNSVQKTEFSTVASFADWVCSALYSDRIFFFVFGLSRGLNISTNINNISPENISIVKISSNRQKWGKPAKVGKTEICTHVTTKNIFCGYDFILFYPRNISLANISFPHFCRELA